MGLFDFLSRPPSKDQFAKTYIDFLRNEGLYNNVTYDPAGFRFLIQQGGTSTYNLANVYNDYCKASKTERKSVLRIASAVLKPPAIPDRYDEVKRSLLPVLRDKATFEEASLQNQLDAGQPIDIAMKIFSRDAVVAFVIDTEQTMGTITSNQLSKWGVSFDQAMTDALDNLRDRTVDAFSELVPGVKLGQWNDAYDSSRLLLPDIPYRAGCGVNPVVMIPSRGRVLVTSAENIDGQLAMVTLAQSFAEQDGRIVSGLMYTFNDGVAIEYEPVDPTVRTQLERFNRELQLERYRSQQEKLRALNEKNGADVFVASYTAMKRSDNSNFSYCTWTQGITDSWMPETDFVVFNSIKEVDGEDPETVHRIVRWQDAVDVVGHLMAPMKFAMTRYRVTEFPSPEVLAQLKETTFS